jgi:Tfp pilus assembly protein PilF
VRNVLERDVMIGAKYRVIRILGRTEGAITYEATAIANQKHVALRVVTLDALDMTMLDTLQREARELAALKHPSLPHYNDHFSVDTLEGPAFCLVQDLAPGRSLAEWRVQGWHPEEREIKRVALALLESLRYLHSLNPPILHLRLNPNNIFREPGGKLWVVDFGDATAQGYVAPEQLQGNPHAASDLYGIGTTLLFLMTGRSPGDLPQREKKLDFRPLVTASSATKSWLERMVDPSPEQRFATAHLAIAALRDGGGRPLTGVAKRRLAIAGIVAGLGIAAFAAVRSFESPRPSTPDEAVSGPPRPALNRFPAMRFAFAIPADPSAVSSVAFTPDGAGLLTTSGDTVKLWDVHTEKLVRTFSGHTDRVSSVNATPEGRYVVSGGDGTLRLWDLQNGMLVRTIPADATAHVTSIAISPDGRSVASAGFDGTANTWFIPAGTVLRSFAHSPAHGSVLSVAFSPDGRRVVTAGTDGVIKVWDATVGTVTSTIEAHTAPVNVVVFAPDGQTFASGSADRTVKIWDVASSKPVNILRLHAGEVTAAAFSPDGNALITSGKDGVVALWAPKSGRLRERYDTPGSRGTLSIAFSKDGSALASAHADGSARVWQMLASMHTEVPLWLVDPPPAPAPMSSVAEERSTQEAKALIDRFSGDPTLLNEAETRLNAALEKNPRYAPALTQLARVEIRRADSRDDGRDFPHLEKALAFTEKALAITPSFTAAIVARAWAYRGLRDPVRAKVLLGDAEKLASYSAANVGLIRLALAKESGDLTGAEASGRGVLEKTRDPHLAARTFEALVTVYRERGDYGAMDQAYRRAIELEPESAWNKGNYAQFLIGLGDYDKAIATAQAALRQQTYAAGQRTLAEAYCTQGVDLFWDRQDAEPAKAAFEHAIASDPSFAESYYGIGAYYLRRHAMEDATRSFKKALELAPDHPFARAALAQAQLSD